MQKIILILFCTTTLFGCSKDKLKKEKEVLIGTWKCKDGVYHHDMCQQPPIPPPDSITPGILNVNYAIQFLREGRIRIYKDGIFKEKGKIHFNKWKNTTYINNGYAFTILVDKNEEKYISGVVNQDTLLLSDSYFFENTKSCSTEFVTCCQYDCYYTRQ